MMVLLKNMKCLEFSNNNNMMLSAPLSSLYITFNSFYIERENSTYRRISNYRNKLI